MSRRVEAHERWIRSRDGDPIWVYDRSGPAPEAPAVVLLHGLGVTAHLNWRPSYAALSEHFRVLALDLRGHGRGARTRRFRLEQCADDVVALCETLGLCRVVVVGYSLGGTIAKLVWKRRRDRVAGLVLAATASEFGRGRRARWLRLLLPVGAGLAQARPEWVRRQLVARTLHRMNGTGRPEHVLEELAGHELRTLVQAVRAAGAFSSRSWLAAIDVPAAVLVTSEDDRIAPERQRAMAATIPEASVFEVLGPHTACVTCPETFVPALVEACRDVWSRARRRVPTASSA